MKIFEKIANFLLPIAHKLNNQRHLAAVRDAFINTMPLVMAASIFVLLNSLSVNYLKSDVFSGLAVIVENGTLGVMGVLVAFSTGYNLSKNIINQKPELGKTGFSPVHAGGLAVAVMFLMMPLVTSITTIGGDAVEVTGVYSKALTSSAGLIYGIFGAILSTELFSRLMQIDKLQIKMPDQVPPAIAVTFKSLFSEISVILIFATSVFGLDYLTGKDIPSLIYAAIQKPLSGFVLSPIGTIFLQFISDTLWALGIHGSPILEPIRGVSLTEALAENIAASAANLPIPNIVTSPFINMYGLIGGGGCVIALVIAIFLVSKRKDYKTVAKLGGVPSVFNITEPIMFGLPVVMNPIFMIPIMFIPSINLLIAYKLTQIGFAAPAIAAPIWVTPPVLQAFLATGGDIGATVLSFGLLVMDVLLFIPFVLVSNKMVEED